MGSLIIRFPFYVLAVFVLILSVSDCRSQVLSLNRKVNWELAGLRESIPDFTNVSDITSFGGSGDGITWNDVPIQNAISSLAGHSGVIYFPPGNYLFTSSIVLPDSVIIRGHSPDSTFLKFDLAGAGQDLFLVQGSMAGSATSLSQSGVRDSNKLVLNSGSGIVAGDRVRISMKDTALLASSWAYGSVGQIARIQSVAGDTFLLDSPLRMNFNISDSAKIIKMNPGHHVGFECFSIERADATALQTSNFSFNYAFCCWIKGVKSFNTNFAHVSVSASSNILISGNYFHHAFSYGGGGEGYGTVLQYSSGECLVENNIFNNLRHSMLLQAGSNGNVFGYNYSVNPFWAQPPFPANSSGDMVLHGNYPYANLFEGNIGQNIVIDNSHGINGPFNTFFRNRAELYGIIMNTGPATDSMNFIGNEIPNTGPFMGNYSLAGNGHFEFGNNVHGSIIPSGTSALADSSLYRHTAPDYFNGGTAWPGIGTPYPYLAGSIPAFGNFADSIFTACTIIPGSGTSELLSNTGNIIYPNPSSGKFRISEFVGENETSIAKIYDTKGAIAMEIALGGGEEFNLQTLSSGIYFLKIKDRFYKLIILY